MQNWAGAHDKAALGSVADLGPGACCPDDPNVRVIIHTRIQNKHFFPGKRQ
jgi:hypothetical protein